MGKKELKNKNGGPQVLHQKNVHPIVRRAQVRIRQLHGCPWPREKNWPCAVMSICGGGGGGECYLLDSDVLEKACVSLQHPQLVAFV